MGGPSLTDSPCVRLGVVDEFQSVSTDRQRNIHQIVKTRIWFGELPAGGSVVHHVYLLRILADTALRNYRLASRSIDFASPKTVKLLSIADGKPYSCLLSLNLCTSVRSSWFTVDAEETDPARDRNTSLAMWIGIYGVRGQLLCVCIRGAFAREMERRGRYSRNPSAFSSLHLCSCIIFRYLPNAYRYPFLAFSSVSCTGRTGEFARGFPRLPRSKERERERRVWIRTETRKPLLLLSPNDLSPLIVDRVADPVTCWFLFSRDANSCLLTPVFYSVLSPFGCRTWSERIEFPSGMNSWRLG